MRSIRIALLLVLLSLAAGCGSNHPASQSSPWVQQANAVCARDDAKFLAASFDTASFVAALRREGRDLDGVGFFTQVPQAAADVDAAGPLLDRSAQLKKARRALLDANRVAASKGVHCSFGSDISSP